MANTRNPRDNVAKGGSGEITPQDKFFLKSRTKVKRVLDGSATFSMKELQRLVAELTDRWG